MDGPLAGVVRAINAFGKRVAAARAQAARVTREGTPAARTVPRTAPLEAASAVQTVAAPRTRNVPSAAAAEASLVTGLFASPQSLAAAFIAAEILAKPVALRDP